MLQLRRVKTSQTETCRLHMYPNLGGTQQVSGWQLIFIHINMYQKKPWFHLKNNYGDWVNLVCQRPLPKVFLKFKCIKRSKLTDDHDFDWFKYTNFSIN